MDPAQSNKNMNTVENFIGSYEIDGKNEEGVTAGVETMKALVRSVDFNEELLPGIPEDVTLNSITPKLFWSDLRVLSSVSTQWRDVIKSGLVYKTRLRTTSTESLAIFTTSSGLREGLSSLLSEMAPQCIKTLFAYSLRNKSSYRLSPIPGCYEAIPRHCEAQSIDGKLYILGGRLEPGDDPDHGSKDVYVLDLAGQMQWKRCASMRESRTCFASAVMEGKIYVFGGTDFDNHNRRCEVYDPKIDAWSWIKPMQTFRRGHKLATVGDELFIYNGFVNNSYYKISANSDITDFPDYAEVYHPVNDEWREVYTFPSVPPGAFAVDGRFLHMINSGSTRDADTTTGGHIFGRPFDGQILNLVQKYSYLEGNDPRSYVGHVLAVGDELLLLQFSTGMPCRLLQSTGFGQKNTKIMWSEIMKVQEDSSLLCSIEL